MHCLTPTPIVLPLSKGSRHAVVNVVKVGFLEFVGRLALPLRRFKLEARWGVWSRGEDRMDDGGFFTWWTGRQQRETKNSAAVCSTACGYDV